MKSICKLTNKEADKLTTQAFSTATIGIATWFTPHNRHGMNASSNTTVGDSPRILGGAATRRVMDGVIRRAVQ